MDRYRLIPLALELVGERPQELQIADAATLAARHYPALSTDRPALIWRLDGAAPWAALGSLLREAYDPDHIVILGADLEATTPTTRTMALGDLDTVPAAVRGMLYVPPLSHASAIETFQGTVAHLRAADGCPWDRKQTHRSLRQGFQEEAYEVLDALDRGDIQDLQEELGDVLLHVLLQVQIAQEAGEFRLSDVVHGVNNKIVYRHPHVFDGVQVDGVQEVLLNWEALKQQEKGERAGGDRVLEGISPTMPALARAQSIQRHVNGLDVVDAETGDLAKQVVARVDELLSARDGAAKGRILGDLLFSLANLARLLEIDAESALREANVRFERHFARRQSS
jgi:tetrapyrrole methylase family protein/MazG family protein